MLFVLQLAFGVFGPNPISDLLTQIITFLPSLVVAIIIIVVAAAVAAAVKTLVDGTLGGLSYGKTLANIASLFILFLGVVAALNQVGVATTVTTPILIAILATVGGVIVVGAGGGLIKPMQHRWESYLSKAEDEAPRIREHAAQAPSAREQARQAAAKAQSGSGTSVGASSTDDLGGRRLRRPRAVLTATYTDGRAGTVTVRAAPSRSARHGACPPVVAHGLPSP